MSAIPQQVLDRQKASINTFVAAQSAVFAGFEKLVELNLKVVLLAAAFSIGTGLFFGYYPARKASLLDPIEALRQQ